MIECFAVANKAHKLGVEYPGAIYHELNRGDRLEPIFRDDEDRLRFVQSLGEVCVDDMP